MGTAQVGRTVGALMVMGMRRRIMAGSLAWAALGACTGSASRPGTPERLRISTGRLPAFALVYLAEAQGFLKLCGLDVSIEEFLVARDALTRVVEGHADVATVLHTPVVSRLREGVPLRILSTLHTSTRNSGVVARADRGIVRAEDLQGRRIGHTPGTASEYMLSLFLATEAIGAAAVTQVPVEPAAYWSSLLGEADGAVDALSAIGPYRDEAEDRLGPKAKTFFVDAYVETSMLVTTEATLRARPEALRRLLRAVLMAQDFAATHAEAAIAVLRRRFEGYFSEKGLRRSWHGSNFAAQIDHVTQSLLTSELKWQDRSARAAKAAATVSAAMAPDLLRALRPGAVTLDRFDRFDPAGR